MFMPVSWIEIKPLDHFILFQVLHLKPVSVELLQNQNFNGLRDVKLFIWQFINLLL